MQYLILLSLIFFTNSYAKFKLCDLNTDFAKAYVEARNNYAQKIKKIRNEKSVTGNSGYFRAKEFKQEWSTQSLSKQVEKIFPNQKVNFEVKNNGKILIYPDKNKVSNGKAIIFDSSGDYFRVVKTRANNGKVIDLNNPSSYFDINGNPLTRPQGLNDIQWKDYKLKHTHFNALP